MHRIISTPLLNTPRWVSALIILSTLAANVAFARVPEALDNIQREARIVADVMRSALRSELKEGMRITAVQSNYLAEQGVLVALDVHAPWITIDANGDANFEFDGTISIPEIPSMVESILHDLQINIAPYEPESLETLRVMREEQRQIRSEQRRIRSELRSTRRERVRSESNALREQLDSKIASLEENLAHVDEKYDTLAVEIESQYDDLRDDRDGFTKTNAPEAPDLDKLIAQTACDYGATLKSLPDSNFLTIMLQRGDGSQVYSFRMDDVRRCSDRDISIDKLLSNSYQYAG